MNPETADTCRNCNAPLIKQLRGRYCPVKLIGRGGFGRTYLAMDGDRLNTYCVIKQFAPQTQGTKSLNKAVQLFEQEAMRLNELGEHSQIPTLLAYFEHDQYLYLVQQMVEGQTLYQEIQRNGPYNEVALRSLLSDLLPVLQFIHERGVIHRDITPTNIIRRSLDGKPVLIDFGVAKQFSESILYEPGTRIGTEGYAPIEQLRSGQAYPSSDLYSFGATCLHLLTGTKPENLYSPMEGRWMWRDRLAQTGRVVHPELGRLLDRLVKDLVSERYQTANEVLADLRSLPSLQGSVPGWVSQSSGGTLFTSAGTPHPSGAQAAASRVPPTVPPRISGPGVSQPGISQPGVSQPRTSRPPTSSPRISSPRSSGPSSVGGGRPTGWQCVRELVGHTSWVTTIAFNPRTPTLVSGSLDDSIKVWNLQSGQLLYTLEGHARGVNEVVIGSKGQVLASCGDDDVVRVWNLLEGSLLHTLKGHIRDVTSVALGVNGFLLASGSEDMTIKLWKLDKGTLLKTLTGSTGMVRSVVLTPNEEILISGGLDNKIRLWNIATGQQVRVLSGHLNSVNQVAVDGQGRFIASASKDRTVRLWELETGALVHTLSDHSQEVNGVAISPDGRTLASGSSDSTLKIWDIPTGQLKYTLTGHTNSVHAIAFHPSGRFIASASGDKSIKVWRHLG